MRYHLCIVTLALAGCSSPDGIRPPGTGVPTTGRGDLILAVGATVQLPGSDSRLTFTGVHDDSRCPVGVMCAWAGRAVVDLTLHSRAGDTPVSLEWGGAKVDLGGTLYGVFALEPAPVYQQPAPDPGSYVVDLCADFTQCSGLPPR